MSNGTQVALEYVQALHAYPERASGEIAKNMKRHVTFALIVSLSVVGSLCVNAIPGGANITEPGKQLFQDSLFARVSADLREKIIAHRQRALQSANTAEGEETVKVIVQFESEPAERSFRHSDQNRDQDNSVLGRERVRGERSLPELDSSIVEVPVSALEELANSPDVSYVSLDREIEILGHVETTTGATAMRLQSGNSEVDGRGIGIAVVDSSIFKSHRSFLGADGKSRVLADVDFTGQGVTSGDPYGHGTHVAALAGGSSREIPEAYEGIAPGAQIINLRVLNSQGQGTVSSLLTALDWIMTRRAAYNIRVVNLSLGALAVDSYRNDPVCRAVRRLVDSGIVVVAAAGNNGKDSTGQKVYGLIHSPGNEPSAITVGATNTFGTDERSDDGVATYSSRGPTRSYSTNAGGVKLYDNLLKPDLVAPGNRLISAQAKENVLVSSHPELDLDSGSGNDEKRMMYLSGSSAAAPIVSGTAALMLQVNPKLTPSLIKTILMYTAQPLAGYNMFEQGTGQVNIEGALRLARLVRTDLTATTLLGSRLLTTTNLPIPQSLIAGQNSLWSQGILLGQTYATGRELISKYQLIYALTHVLAEGDIEFGGRLIANPTSLTGGITLGSNILISDGHLLADGLPFLSTSMLLGDGHLLGDGLLLGDGHLLSDGHLLADQSLLADARFQALVAMIEGDR